MSTAVNFVEPAAPLTTLAPNETDSPRQRWLAERRSFIGGSEAHELLNQPQYGKGCVRALAYRKLNTPPDYPEQLDEALLERGNILEPVVAAMYEEETGRKLRRGPLDADGQPKVERHPEYPFLGVHIDRKVLAGHGGVTETGTAEIKTHGEGPFWNILRTGLPPSHNLQIQHGMFIKRHSWGPFIILGVFGGLPLKHFDVQRDQQVCEIIVREGEKFANTVWGRGQLPDFPFASDDQRCKVCAFRMTCRGEELDLAEAAAVNAVKCGKEPLVQISNPNLLQNLRDRELVKQELAATGELLETIESKIHEQLADCDRAFVSGYGKVYRIPSQANYLDGKRLKADKPEVYESYFVKRLTGDYYLRTYPVGGGK
jgi:predicted phage-related endonuclease